MRDDIRKIFFWFGVAAGALTALDLSLYIFKFAPGQWWTISSNTEDWARFGEFVGGTLGPAFALLAFGAALFTISEQGRQASLEELQRLIFSMHEGLNKLLSANAPKLGELASPQFHDAETLGQLLVMLFRKSIWSSPDAQSIIQIAVEEAGGSVRREAYVLVLELIHLVRLLREYERQGGSDAVVSFYRDRHRELVCSLEITRLLTSGSVRVFFDPAESIAQAQEAAKIESESAAVPNDPSD